MALPTSNQFSITPIQGEIDLSFGAGNNIISGLVSASQATPLVAGQAVKLDPANTGPLPKFLAITANSDSIWGFVTYNFKDQSRPLNTPLEVAMKDTVMYMTASAAITAGVKVEYDFATLTVKTAAGVNPASGFAIDSAAANGSLIRVYIQTPIGGNAAVDSLVVSATLAEINAGKLLIPGVAGKSIVVTSFIERVTGAFTTGTSVDLQSDSTSVIVESTAEAGLTNGAVLVPGTANVTLGAGFGVALPVGEGLKVLNKGTASAGGTSISYTISYDLV